MAIITIAAGLSVEGINFAIAQGGGSEASFPLVSAALDQAQKLIAENWKVFALGANNLSGIEPLKHPQGNYARSIQTGKSNFKRIVYSDSPVAGLIERGHPAFDMKQTHTIGPKSRRTKDGKYSYVIVPFRFGTPKAVRFGGNVMDNHTYRQVEKQSLRSAVSPGYHSPNAQGEQVFRNSAEWKGKGKHRLSAPGTNMHGMIRSDGTMNEAGIRNEKSGGYVTFRVISNRNLESVGWINPYQKAKPVSTRLAELNAEAIGKALLNAWEQEMME